MASNSRLPDMGTPRDLSGEPRPKGERRETGLGFALQTRQRRGVAPGEGGGEVSAKVETEVAGADGREGAHPLGVDQPGAMGAYETVSGQRRLDLGHRGPHQ